MSHVSVHRRAFELKTSHCSFSFQYISSLNIRTYYDDNISVKVFGDTVTVISPLTTKQSKVFGDTVTVHSNDEERTSSTKYFRNDEQRTCSNKYFRNDEERTSSNKYFRNDEQRTCSNK